MKLKTAGHRILPIFCLVSAILIGVGYLYYFFSSLLQRRIPSLVSSLGSLVAFLVLLKLAARLGSRVSGNKT